VDLTRSWLAEPRDAVFQRAMVLNFWFANSSTKVEISQFSNLQFTNHPTMRRCTNWNTGSAVKDDTKSLQFKLIK